jgi:hypothetical protein
MDEHRQGAPPGPTRTYDTELNFRSIVTFSLGVVVVTVVAAAVMWWMSALFKQQEEAKDRAPSPLPEARLDSIPPGPRLQPSPPRDMDELRAHDREALTTYGWVDRSHGVAHIPIDRAISILAEKGAAKK